MRTGVSEKFGRGLFLALEKDREAALKAWEKRRAGAYDPMPDHVVGPPVEHLARVNRELERGLMDQADIVGKKPVGPPESAAERGFHWLSPEEKTKVEGVRKEIDAHVKKLVKKSNTFIRVMPGALDKILDSGRIKSQFETGKSKGSYDPEFRAATEHRMFGTPDDKKWSPEKRPVYGYLSDDEHGGILGAKDRFNGTDMYGEIAIKLKDKVKGRTTFMTGDSLGEYGAIPRPVLKPDHMAVPLRFARPKYHDKIDDVAVYAEAQVHGGVPLSDIDHVVFPFSKEDDFSKQKAALAAKGVSYKQLGDPFVVGRGKVVESHGLEAKESK